MSNYEIIMAAKAKALELAENGKSKKDIIADISISYFEIPAVFVRAIADGAINLVNIRKVGVSL